MAPAGTFQGFIKKAILEPHVPFCNFLGIPYAEPPIGNKRFAVKIIHPVFFCLFHANFASFFIILSSCEKFKININLDVQILQCK